jgi:hypothetical protein
MTAAQRKIWVKSVKAHVEKRLKDAVREGVVAYWPVTDKYDAEVTEEAKLLFATFRGAMDEAVRRAKL